METQKIIEWVAVVLVIIGALNWGLFGLMGTDIVLSLPAVIQTPLYALIGVAGLYMIYYAATKMK